MRYVFQKLITVRRPETKSPFNETARYIDQIGFGRRISSVFQRPFEFSPCQALSKALISPHCKHQNPSRLQYAVHFIYPIHGRLVTEMSPNGFGINDIELIISKEIHRRVGVIAVKRDLRERFPSPVNGLLKRVHTMPVGIWERFPKTSDCAAGRASKVQYPP